MTGGQTDAGIIPVTAVTAGIARGDMKLLGFTGDEVQWQLGALFTATKTISERRGTVDRFLRAYRKAVGDYHDAFIGPDEKRKNGPTAPEILALIAKDLGQRPEQVETALPYIDPQLRLDVKDVQHQLDWYKSEGMLKGEIKPEQVMDKTIVTPLP